jgi:hypothetical protein
VTTVSVSGTAFYCMSSREYFLGAATLINSLRLAGHRQPVFLLDCGLDPEQRRLLEPEAVVVDAPAGEPPYMLKTVLPLSHPAEVMVLIDVDMIATRPLTELIDGAGRGEVVAFANAYDRFVEAWGPELGFGEARRGRYVSSGLVALGGAEGAEVVRLLDDRLRRVDFARTVFGSAEPAYPFHYADQDVLNAILATTVEPERVRVLDNRLAPNPPYRGLRIEDLQALRCSYRDGTEPFVVHQYLRKPWLDRTYDGVYSRLQRHLLAREDVPVRVPAEAIPSRLRPGAHGAVQRAAINLRDYPRWRYGASVPRPIGRHIERWRRRRERPSW